MGTHVLCNSRTVRAFLHNVLTEIHEQQIMFSCAFIICFAKSYSYTINCVYDSSYGNVQSVQDGTYV